MTCKTASSLSGVATAPQLPAQPPTTPAVWASVRSAWSTLLRLVLAANSHVNPNIIPPNYATFNGSTLPSFTAVGCTVAQDATITYGGAKTLKVSVTATNATLSFGGTNLSITPYAMWLLSFFARCTELVSANIIITTGAGTYTTGFSFGSTATWDQFYDTVNMVADGNAVFGLSLSFPNCVGAVFNFTGFGLQQTASAQNVSPPLGVIGGTPGVDLGTAIFSGTLPYANNSGQVTQIVGNNAGNGQLNVSPAGGVISNLPHANLSTQALQVISNVSGNGQLNVNPTGGVTNTLPYSNNSGPVTTTIAGTVDTNGSYLQHGVVFQPHIHANQIGWGHFVGDTSGNYSGNLVDALNLRFLHSAMSTPAQATLASTAGGDGSYLNTSQIFNRHLASASQSGLADDASAKMFRYGTLAGRPAAGTAGRIYHASDAGTNGITYRDTGSAWTEMAVGHLADINGTTDNVTEGTNKFAAEHGADITGNHTSADTNHVSGTPSSSVALSSVTGNQVNLIPDSGLKSPGIYWPDHSGGLITVTQYLDGYNNCFAYVGTGAPSGYQYRASLPIPVTQNTTYTLSAYVVGGNITIGSAFVGIYNTAITTGYSSLTISNLSSGRIHTSITIPAGVSQVVVIFDTNNCTVSNGNGLLCQQMQLEVGSVMTAFRESTGDNLNGSLGIDFSKMLHLNKTQSNVADDANAKMLRFGTLAARPAAGTSGRIYHASDAGTNGITYRDTGTAWVEVGVGHLADINGTTDNVTEGTNKFAAEHGADITGNHTSADTNHVSGTLSSSVALSSVTGAQRNLVPDSGMKSQVVYWPTLVNLALINGFQFPGTSGGNAFQYTGTGAAAISTYAESSIIPVTPGTTYAFRGYIRAANVTAGTPVWVVESPNRATSYLTVSQTAGSAGVVTGTFTVPAGVTGVAVEANANGCTVINGTEVEWCDPKLEVGTVSTAYHESVASDNAGSLLINTGNSGHTGTWQHSFMSSGVQSAIASSGSIVNVCSALNNTEQGTAFDGSAVTFLTAFPAGTSPIIVYLPGGLTYDSTLPAGSQQQAFSVTGLSNTGFTPVLKIQNIPATPTNQSVNFTPYNTATNSATATLSVPGGTVIINGAMTVNFSVTLPADSSDAVTITVAGTVEWSRSLVTGTSGKTFTYSVPVTNTAAVNGSTVVVADNVGISGVKATTVTYQTGSAATTHSATPAGANGVPFIVLPPPT